MKYEYICWCKEDKHDKVWGLVELAPNKYMTFWGRRGAKLQTKISEMSDYKATDALQSKLRKGYIRVHKSDLDTIYPEFQEELEKAAFWNRFKV
jgi:hypothetical protein